MVLLAKAVFLLLFLNGFSPAKLNSEWFHKCAKQRLKITRLKRHDQYSYHAWIESAARRSL